MAESSQSNEGTQTTTEPPKAVDLTKLEGEDLQKVLENPNLFKLPRIADALNAQKELKKVQEQQSKAQDASLAEQKKWEELANKRATENETLQKQIQDGQINNALSSKLYGEKVVDLDGALKLIDKSKISVDESGQMQGLDEAIETLKSDKAYLFTSQGSQRVGNPSNPSNPATAGTGRYKFKESQLTPSFYKDHKAEIDEAGRQGLIEQDGPPSSF